jgi:hypothetical protein
MSKGFELFGIMKWFFLACLLSIIVKLISFFPGYSHQVSSAAKNGPQYFSIINLLVLTGFCLKAKI